MIEIIAASENEISIIEDILLDTVQWLDSTGQSLWREEQIKWPRLSKDFKASDFQIALLDGIPAACMVVSDHSPTFSSDEPSLFICKLAVKRFAAGKNLSDIMISHAKSMCMDRGISALRLDCSAVRPKLRAVYERNGFICVEEKDFFIADKKIPVAFYRCEVKNFSSYSDWVQRICAERISVLKEN
jgi:GNAT superfamily N-acetyltransferase